MEELLQGLNEAQRQAVTATEGCVRVIAGAGSGKTRALARRFAFLVNEAGIRPGGILCVTFTNKSAAEMRRRIHDLTGDDDTGYICTFHSFCVSVLQEDSHAVQYPKNFLVLDNADIDAMLKTVYDERGLTLRHMTFAKARDMIEIRKIFKEPEYYRDMIAMELSQLQEKYRAATEPEDIIFYGYLFEQKKCFGLDYNDLIKFTLYIFEQDDTIRLKWQKRLEYIMIDEFQDIDELQYRLMQVLCDYHKNLFIVGDPDQTIYTWRGANVRYLMDFDKAFPGTRTILMMQNYRSTPQILAVANDLIAKNRDRIRKELLPTLPDGPAVVCHHAETAREEADWIAERLCRLHEDGTPWREMAVLYRANYLTRTLEEAFLEKQIPYLIYSGVQFFGRAEIKDALSYLRLLAYRDDLSFRRVANVPRRNLGRRRMAYLEAYAAEHQCSLYDAMCANLESEQLRGTKAAALVRLVETLSAGADEQPVSELLSNVLDRSGYEELLRTEGSQERLDNLAELKQAVYEYETTCGEEATLEHYLTHVALMTAADTASNRDAVRLMTVHTAKGLEFPHVFLCGLNEGVFPSRKTRTRAAMEEERRLAFVALTRAEKTLALSDAWGWNLDGTPRYPSRFLLEIDPSLLEFTAPPSQGMLSDARISIARSERRLDGAAEEMHFAPGDRVRHSIFGAGVVLETDLDQRAYVIQFDQMTTPRTITFRAHLDAADGAAEGGSV
jgi:DNA helicase-2/ATP-dependent DNA helicase PcrA